MRLNFRNEYAKLNTEQKTAVDYIDGPLLVIAGPGTGKTQLLSLRAANILNQTDALAENLLCLTFTESGAQEMRRRLIGMIGDQAYRITISTYHGFGSEIIRRNPAYFSGNINLRPIDKLKSETIIRELQKTLPFSSPLKSAKMVSNITELIAQAKQALLTPDDLTGVATANLAFISAASELTKPLSEALRRVSLKAVDSFSRLTIKYPKSQLPAGVEPLGSLWNSQLKEALEDTAATRKAKPLTKWKAKYLARDGSDLVVPKGSDQNQQLKEFAELYKSYVARLKYDNLYDYADMILLAIDALKSHDELRYNLQEKYLYIMLDEYQDTNLAQAELTYLLSSNPASEGRPNVMALGDDDQAIFAFQGAKHSNMLDFSARYKSVKLVTLKSNYRSGQGLIDLSTQVADQIAERLTTMLSGVNKDFKAARKGPVNIQSLNFTSEIEQYAWLADNLKHSPSQDIAIIAPEHKYLERASAYLADKQIPISYERRENVLDDPVIQEIITILRLLKAINDKDNRAIDTLAPIVLNYEFWGLPTAAIWKLSWRAYDHSEPWIDVMVDTPATRLVGLMLLKLAANALSYRYDFIIDQVMGLSDIVINDSKTKAPRSKFSDYHIGPDNDLARFRLYQNLSVIREEFKDFNLDNNRPLMVGGLIDFIDELTSSNIKLTNDFNYGTPEARVKLMTAHGSKGQEFDSVYLLSFINEVWGSKSGGWGHIALPPNLEYIRHGAEESEDEKLRLLYVALTRAKQRLVTLAYSQDAAAKDTTALKYLALATSDTTFKADLMALWQVEDRPIELATDLKAMLKKRLETYSLSPTHLNTFIDVRSAGPESFYKSVLLKYKTPVSSRVDYGSAVHDTLDWLQQSLSSTKKLPTLVRLIREFEIQLQERRLPSDDFKQLKDQGIQSLTAYYQANKSGFSVEDISEYDFRSEGLTLGQARLGGKIDKLVINKPDKTLTIVDYKTGASHERWRSEPRLHLYENQLYFYKLLVEKSPNFRGYRVAGGELDFVEPDRATKELNKLPLVYDDQAQERLAKLIAAVWRHIEDLNFPSVRAYKNNLADIKRFEDDLINGRI